MSANTEQTASGRGQKSRTPKPTEAKDRIEPEMTEPIKTELVRTPKPIPPISCAFIPELPFPWNGAFLEWQKRLRNRTGYGMSGEE